MLPGKSECPISASGVLPTVQDHKLFDMIKEDRPQEDKEACATLVAALAGLVAVCAALVAPYMPTTTDKVTACSRPHTDASFTTLSDIDLK